MAESDFVFESGEPIDVGSPVENDYVEESGELVSDGDVSDFAFISGRGFGGVVSANLVAAGLGETTTALKPDDGSDVWTTDDLTPGNVSASVDAIKVGPEEEVVYVGVGESLIALDAATGGQNWKYDDGDFTNSIALPNNGSQIYTVSSQSPEITSVSPNGNENWTYTGVFSSDASLNDITVTSDGKTVFAGSELIFSGSGGDKLASIDTSTQTANWHVDQYPSGVSAVGISPDNKTVYGATEDGEYLRAHDAIDGSKKWTFSGYPQYYGPNSIVVDSDGTIYSGNGNGDVIAVGPDGNELWSQTVGIGTIKGITVSPDSSTIFTTSQDFGSGQISATDGETGSITQWSRSYGIQPDDISTIGEYK